MMYRVRVQEFEGPLDLLLFFIRRDELDIFDIPIAYITEEYLSFVRVLEQIDLDSVGEFLYMAAMLINIKARMLLPRPDLDDEGEPIDPRRELVERLLEYVRFKEASQQFATLKERRDELFTRGLAGRPADADDSSAEVTIEASVFDLVHSLRRILAIAPEPELHSLVREDYSIEEQQSFVLEAVGYRRQTSFAALVAARSRAFVVTTFLAVLELAREGLIAILSGEQPLDFYLEATSS